MTLEKVPILSPAQSISAGPPIEVVLFERCDDGSMIGGLLSLALVAVNLHRDATFGKRSADQYVIDPQPPAPMKGSGAVVPPRIKPSFLMVDAQRVAQSPVDQVAEGLLFRLTEQDFVAPLFRVPDVPVLGCDVEISAD